MTTNEQKQVDALRLFILNAYTGTTDLNLYLKDDELLNSIKKCSIEQLEIELSANCAFTSKFEDEQEATEYITESYGLDYALNCARDTNTEGYMTAIDLAENLSMYTNQDRWDRLVPHILTTIEILNKEL